MIKNNLSSNLNNNEKGDDNNPLSNEELSRLIKASKEGAFQSKKIKKDIEENFKKVSLHDIAKNYSQNAGSTNDSGSKVKEDESLEKLEDINVFAEDLKNINEDTITNNENKDINNENKEVANNTDINITDEKFETKETSEEKKTLEEKEYLKLIEQAKEEAFEKGKKEAYSEVKEGADAAVAKLNSIGDKIARTDQLDLSEFENIISEKILSLSSELTGKIIKAIPTEFLKKIKNFISMLDNNEGNIEIFVSEDEYKVLQKNKDIKNKLNEMNLNSKKGLLNGEVELKINGILIKHKLES